MSLTLGLNTGYWAAGPPPPSALESVREAERLGFDSVWTSEAYGCDVLTPLAWWGSHTQKIRLGTAIMQMSARRPTAAAMAAMTMDHLSGGRFVLGLGVSGPQVVEGWYGEPFAKPLARTREYVGIVRDVVARRERVASSGPHYRLPANGREGVTGLGKPLKSTLRPLRERLPVYLAAEGPKNIALTAEIADGWLALFYSPHHDGELYRPRLEEGFARRGEPHPDFEILASIPFIVHDDVEQAADLVRPRFALYFGGMGARGANFHHDVAVRMGYEAEAAKIQELYLDGQEGRGRRRRPDEARRGARAHRARRQDPPRPRGLARVERHLAAHRRSARDTPPGRGAGARMSYRFATYEKRGRIAYVTLNRPEVMNALHLEAHLELAEIWEDFRDDPDVWVAILTGSGERAFSAGNDLKVTAERTANGGDVQGDARPPFGRITRDFQCPKPMIAAVNGVAVGGGLEMALACDIIIAADHARFGLPEPRVGLFAGAGGVHRLARQLPFKVAMGLLLTGRLFGAEEAERIGLVNEVVPIADLMPAAERWAADDPRVLAALGSADEGSRVRRPAAQRRRRARARS